MERKTCNVETLKLMENNLVTARLMTLVVYNFHAKIDSTLFLLPRERMLLRNDNAKSAPRWPKFPCGETPRIGCLRIAIHFAKEIEPQRGRKRSTRKTLTVNYGNRNGNERCSSIDLKKEIFHEHPFILSLENFCNFA